MDIKQLKEEIEIEIKELFCFRNSLDKGRIDDMEHYEFSGAKIIALKWVLEKLE